MSDAERFDDCYVESRDRLLVAAFGLTGDLSASRGAVRDAFVAAWHHWPHVGQLEDPETWLRGQVLPGAQRRHALRMWHRDRVADEDVQASLRTLAALPAPARRATLMAGAGRTTPPELEALAAHVSGQRWPRATIVRRAGARRRRTHTVVGAVLVVAALVGGGMLVGDRHGVHPTLAGAGDRLTSVPAPGAAGPTPAGVQVTSASLVSRAELSGALRGRVWRITGTDPHQGMTFPCQRRELADPRAPVSLVRNFVARHDQGERQLVAVQAMELSSDAAAARAGYAAASGWFAGCATPQMQLLAVRRVHGLGDQAEQFVLRGWQAPVATYVVGVARTGLVTTVTLTRTAGRARPALTPNLRLLGAAVANLCSTSAAGRCPATPKATTVAAPAAGKPATMLSEWDLPPVAGVPDPWVGTTPRRAVHNVAATGCDKSSFTGPGWAHDTTRSFLVPGGGLSAAFGITETVGRLPAPKARQFVGGVIAKLASCPHREPGTKVHRLAGGAGWASWQVRTQVTGQQTLTFLMGIVRHGGAVAQVGFVPDHGHTMTTTAFVALVHRAGERLAAMP